MMLVWNNLADPHLSAFSHFAWFSQTVTLKQQGILAAACAVLGTSDADYLDIHDVNKGLQCIIGRSPWMFFFCFSDSFGKHRISLK